MTSPKIYLMKAALDGDLAAAQRWILTNESTSLDPEALETAASEGHIALVDLLLPLTDARANESKALQKAILNGHHAIVERLLPFSDPNVRDGMFLIYAAESGHDRCVALLVPHCDVQAAWQEFEDNHDFGPMDTLSPYVPEAWLEAALDDAPEDEMPKTRERIQARALAQKLGDTLAPTQTSLKPRF